MSDILADKKRSEAELSEAVAVLAQITAPWIKDNHSLQSLSQFLGDLVKSLTRKFNYTAHHSLGLCKVIDLSIKEIYIPVRNYRFIDTSDFY